MGADGQLAVNCDVRDIVTVGATAIWDAVVVNGSGDYHFDWTDGTAEPILQDGGRTALKAYAEPGLYSPTVTVTDLVTGQQATNEDELDIRCRAYVLPLSFVEPPSVNPYLWVPADSDLTVNPNSLTDEFDRLMRAIRAGYFRLFGATFKANATRVVQSTRTEQSICDGGDCAVMGQTSQLVGVAKTEVSLDLGGTIPFTREAIAIAWGGGGEAHHGRWASPLGVVGDWTFTSAAGLLGASVEPDVAYEFPVAFIGDHHDSWQHTIAHEIAHGIAWDIPHDFGLTRPHPERRIRLSQASPWMTETLSDLEAPTVSVTSPAQDDTTVSGTVTVVADATDNVHIEAVDFTVDGYAKGIDKSPPYRLSFDTTKVQFGRHMISAMAFDDEGNYTRTNRTVLVRNIVGSGSCSGSSPSNAWRVCFYDGTNGAAGPFLGEIKDALVRIAPNAGHLIRHRWQAGEEIAFGESETLSGVWRGTVDFGAEPYNPLLRVFADDGVRIYVDNQLVLDAWDQVGVNEIVVLPTVDDPTPVRVEWRQQLGSGELRVFWQPTAQGTTPFFPPGSIVFDPPLGASDTVHIKPGQRLQVHMQAVDPDLDLPLRYSARAYMVGSIGLLGASLTEHGDGSATIEWIPDPDWAGLTLDITVTVRDAKNLTNEFSFSVAIDIPIEPFCIVPQSSVEGPEDDLLRTVFYCDDLQGGPLTYSAAGLPTGSVFARLGDANFDGQLTGADQDVLTDFLGTVGDVTTPQQSVADMNGDGRVTGRDVTLLTLALGAPNSEAAKRYIVAWRPTFSDAGTHPVSITFQDSTGFATVVPMELVVRNKPQLTLPYPMFFIVGFPLRYTLVAEDDLEQVRFGVMPRPAGAQVGPMGDANLDGNLTISDSVRLAQFLSGAVIPNEVERAMADANGDSQLTSADHTRLSLYLAGSLHADGFIVWNPTEDQMGLVFLHFTAGNSSETVVVSASAIVTSCAVAAAAFEGEPEPDLETLREFRDQVLQESVIGRAFVGWYYRVSPSITRFMADKPRVRALARAALQPLVWTVEQTVASRLPAPPGPSSS